jgi:oligopeptidase A
MDARNPLLELADRLSSATALPFAAVDAAHVEPAVHELLARARAELARICDPQTPRSYAAVLGALEAATEPLEAVMGVVSLLESVATTPALRAAHNAVQAPVSEFFSDLLLDDALYRALRDAAADTTALTPTQQRHLDKTLDAFRRHGAELAPADKARLREIDVELALATTTFAQHVLDATAAFERIVADERQIAGLPASAADAAHASARERGHEGWRFTLQGPSLIAALTYLHDEALREELYRASNARATAGEFDNRELLATILGLRAEKARLLGFRDFADLTLADRMARDGDTAERFVRDLTARCEAAFERERAELEAFAQQCRSDPADPAYAPDRADERLAPWSLAYFAERMRRVTHDFDPEVLRDYFPVDRVVEGMFAIAARLFGLRIEPTDALEVWHPDVRTYAILDDDGNGGGAVLARFYADFYPRDTKRGGAWMHGLLTAVPGERPALGLIAANATPPLAGRPACLSHDDVQTLFHEFGHLLHHALSQVEVRSLAGTQVAWDFVELPSQLLENWTWEPEALALIGGHVTDGHPIPAELIAKLRSTRAVRGATAMMRQLGFAAVDLGLHRHYDSAEGNALAFARTIMQRYTPAPLPADYAMVASFTHLFAGPTAYAAGYYSYKWAEVLDADAFALFLERGLFDRATGRALRERVLARGDSEPPEALFRAFRGRDPELAPLLTRSGLAPTAA